MCEKFAATTSGSVRWVHAARPTGSGWQERLAIPLWDSRSCRLSRTPNETSPPSFHGPLLFACDAEATAVVLSPGIDAACHSSATLWGEGSPHASAPERSKLLPRSQTRTAEG